MSDSLGSYITSDTDCVFMGFSSNQITSRIQFSPKVISMVVLTWCHGRLEGTLFRVNADELISEFTHFNLVVRLSKMKQLALRFCTFSTSCIFQTASHTLALARYGTGGSPAMVSIVDAPETYIRFRRSNFGSISAAIVAILFW